MWGAVGIPVSDDIMVARVEPHILLALSMSVFVASRSVVCKWWGRAGDVCHHHVARDLCSMCTTAVIFGTSA